MFPKLSRWMIFGVLSLLVAQVPGVAAAAENITVAPTSVGATNSETAAESTTVLAVAEVSLWSRDATHRGRLVKFQGVATSVLAGLHAFVIEENSAAIYVRDTTRTNPLPQLGERWEVQGRVETGSVGMNSFRRLGMGRLPEPTPASWDQLMNGSLDMRQTEIRGVIESLLNRRNGWSRVDLRTRDGVVRIELRRAGIKPGPLEQFEGAVIRVRGKVFVDRYSDGRVKVGQLRMHDAEILVDEPALPDAFAVPTTSVAALLRSDPDYNPFRRVKVAGQIVFIRGWDYFLMDGENGLRFVTSQPHELAIGDLVEVAGFSEVSGASPVLRSALVRKTGHAALPKPRILSPDDLIRPSLDSTLVSVAGTLASIRQTQTNLVMEMQSGSWRFLARLNASKESARLPELGSRLNLTGVYCAQGGYKALGEDVAAVDLLLSSPQDIQVLSTPPWWTLPRLLVVAGVLAFLLVAALLWVTQLQRRVEQRGAELQVQIHNRERAEHQRVLEQERARIAHDLHDQLGADITEIGMLASRVRSVSSPDAERGRCLDQMADKAGLMVSALEEIVWAMNPQHDSLSSVVSYFSFFADRFLGLANIRVKMESSPGVAGLVVDARMRHQLFLVFKEALTNVVNHAGATEVHLKFCIEEKMLRVVVADNGRGISATDPTDGQDGIANMRTRVEKLGGRFDLTSEPGRGTTLSFAVPLN